MVLMKLSRGATQALLFELESIGSGLFEVEAAIVGEVAVSSELALLTDMFIVTAGSATVPDNQSPPLLLWPNGSWKLSSFSRIIFSFTKGVDCAFFGIFS
jgi:hypothetical protein